MASLNLTTGLSTEEETVEKIRINCFSIPHSPFVSGREPYLVFGPTDYVRALPVQSLTGRTEEGHKNIQQDARPALDLVSSSSPTLTGTTCQAFRFGQLGS